MKHIILAGIVAALLGISAYRAEAQTLAADIVPSHEVFAIVRSMGLSPLGRPSLRGGVYVMQASNRYGEPVRVVVDARAGQVVSVRPLARGPYVYDEPVRRPPAPIPGRFVPAEPRYVPPRPAPPPELDDDQDDVGSLREERPRVLGAPKAPDVPSAPSARSALAKAPLPRPRPTARLAAEQNADVTGSVNARPQPTLRPDPKTPPMQGFD